MSDPKIDQVYEKEVTRISRSGNPVIETNEWERKVVVVIDEGHDISKGDDIEFVVKQSQGDHYQGLLNGEAPIKKPQRYGTPNVSIHHDGKHGESVGDTRGEWHASKRVEDRY